MRLDSLYRRIGELKALEYAATSKTKTEKKNCKTGYPCGYGCISKTKNCKSPIGKQASSYADWMSGQAQKAEPTQKPTKSAKGPKKTTPKATKPKVDPVRQATPNVEVVQPKKAIGQMTLSKGGTAAEINKTLSSMEKEAKAAADKDPRLKDNHEVISAMKANFKKLGKAGYRELKDENGVVQAVAIVSTKKGATYLEFLATAPHNMSEDDPRKTKGSGAKIMEEIIKGAINKGDGSVSLKSYPKAQGFYRKVGFEDSNDFFDMRLSKEKGQQFLRSRGVDFADRAKTLEELEDEAFGAFAISPDYSPSEEVE
jgi:hypothetical protein